MKVFHLCSEFQIVIDIDMIKETKYLFTVKPTIHSFVMLREYARAAHMHMHIY